MQQDSSKVTTVGVNDGWRDTTENLPMTTSLFCSPGWEHSYITNNTFWSDYRHGRKIRLTLSEILYLREVARENKKLRKILRRFSDHIEVTIDFPG